jgi:hypothetical protein
LPSAAFAVQENLTEESMNTMHAVFETDSHHLAALLALDDDTKHLCRPEELGDVLCHQLNAPLDLDLGEMGEDAQAAIADCQHASERPLRTFGDLLSHPEPPLELLKRVKEFGKRHHRDPHSALPREIALFLYYASIVCALARCGKRITRLPDETLREGVEWFIGQPWISKASRALFRQPIGPGSAL